MEKLPTKNGKPKPESRPGPPTKPGKCPILDITDCPMIARGGDSDRQNCGVPGTACPGAGVQADHGLRQRKAGVSANHVQDQVHTLGRHRRSGRRRSQLAPHESEAARRVLDSQCSRGDLPKPHKKRSISRAPLLPVSRSPSVSASIAVKVGQPIARVDCTKMLAHADLAPGGACRSRVAVAPQTSVEYWVVYQVTSAGRLAMLDGSAR